MQVVICRRSSGGLFVMIKSRLSGGMCLAGLVCLISGEYCTACKQHGFNVAGHSNQRPKYPLLVLCLALFIAVVNDTRGSD